MNIYLHELKSYRKSTIIWTLSLCFIIVFFFSLYPSFSNNAEQIFGSFPEVVRKAFGILLDYISSILGFYSYIILYVILIGAIQAMNFGASVISKETRDKTADFLLTKPVTRVQIISSKIMATLTCLLITNIIYLLVATMMAYIMSKDALDISTFLMISLTLLFIQLIFFTLGILISVLLPRIKSVISITLGTVFSLFILNMFGSVIGEKAIRYFTPFKYFDFTYIITNKAYEVRFIIIELIIIIISVVLSYIIYIKKDIHSV